MLATVSALSSQNLGAGKPERAAQTLKYAAMIATGYGIAVVLVIELVAEPLLGCFTTDAAVVLMGCQYIRGYIVDTIFAGIHFSFTGYFAACGKSYIGFLHNIIAIVLVRVPGSYLASRLFAGTLLPMGLAAPAGSLLSVIICVAGLPLDEAPRHPCILPPDFSPKEHPPVYVFSLLQHSHLTV